ncbi:MAG: Mrp/NBP35 family ATP-binding protein [Syntrophorhabdaceae bacterium]|nr:Mrp/NBP35 family ATP-binding protein [Syntrophorhabdaceae bacterium]
MASGSKCDTCDKKNSCGGSGHHENESEQERQARLRLQSRLCRIKHKIVVMSGKGGVGKSTVAVNIATSLMLAGKRVGLMDVDIHGPSIPTMLGLEEQSPLPTEDGSILPIQMGDMKVMSVGFFLRNQDEAVIWRGPMKNTAITQFLRDVEWGDLDFLIIDSPPGTGDEPLSVVQIIGSKNLDGAVIVTTPQRVASVDVRKSISFCNIVELPVLGVVENMSGFACPGCGTVTPILRSGGGKKIAQDMKVPFLGAVPIDPKVAEASDSGQAFVQHFADTATAKIMREIVKPFETM